MSNCYVSKMTQTITNGHHNLPEPNVMSSNCLLILTSSKKVCLLCNIEKQANSTFDKP